MHAGQQGCIRNTAVLHAHFSCVRSFSVSLGPTVQCVCACVRVCMYVDFHNVNNKVHDCVSKIKLLQSIVHMAMCRVSLSLVAYDVLPGAPTYKQYKSKRENACLPGNLFRRPRRGPIVLH